MMKKILLIILIALQGINSEAQTIYVSPVGNDNNPGTKEKPVATFEKAQLQARKTDKSNRVEVIFASGVYYLPQTVKVTKEDSREDNAPLIFRAEEEGRVVLSGGSIQKLDWKKYKNEIYVAKVSENPEIDQLYINGKRQRMARFPNAVAGKNVFDTWDLSHQAKSDSTNTSTFS